MFKKVAFTYYPVTDVLGRASSTRRRSASSPARPATRATTGGWNTTCPAGGCLALTNFTKEKLSLS
jgi:hypothetical protein